MLKGCSLSDSAIGSLPVVGLRRVTLSDSSSSYGGLLEQSNFLVAVNGTARESLRAADSLANRVSRSFSLN